MNTFFVESLDESVSLCGDDHNHLKKSLRIRPGEKVKLSDGAGSYGIYRVVETADTTLLEREGGVKTKEVPVKINLYQGIPKKKKLETIAQKCTELGVNALTPVVMKYCERPQVDFKRLEKIILEAAKQSGNPILPQIGDIKTVNEINPKEDLILVAYEKENRPLKEVLESRPDAKNIAVFIGPEGGFSEEEVLALKDLGAQSVSLGENILRTETAGPSVLSVLRYVYG